MEQLGAAQQYVELDRLCQRIADSVRRIPGVASIARSDLRVHFMEDGNLQLDCTLTTYQNVQLHILGVAVQQLIAKLVREHAGIDARVVNVYIHDIDARAVQPSGRMEKQFDHG